MIACLRRALSLAVPVLLLAGCSERGAPMVTQPELAARAPERTVAQSGADLSRLAMYDVRPNITIAWAKQWIGPEGGRLEFQGFAVDVPAGAVDRVTQFSIRLPVDPYGADRVVAEFGPHGAVFAKPVTIELPYSGTTVFGVPNARVVWWDGTAWVSMGGVVTADGARLATPTGHFSTFGVSDQQDSWTGQVQTSGG